MELESESEGISFWIFLFIGFLLFIYEHCGYLQEDLIAWSNKILSFPFRSRCLVLHVGNDVPRYDILLESGVCMYIGFIIIWTFGHRYRARLW